MLRLSANGGFCSVCGRLLAMLPGLPSPPGLALVARYLYLPFAGSAIGVAIFFELARRLQNRFAWGAAIALGVAGLVVWNSVAIAESAVNFDGTVRQSRLQFRPIFQSFAGFDSDTLLYFFEPPLESRYISACSHCAMVGMSGRMPIALFNQSVGGVIIDDYLWQDDSKNWHWQSVAKGYLATTTPGTARSFCREICLIHWKSRVRI